MNITKHNVSILDFIQISHTSMFLSCISLITVITLIIILPFIIKKKKNIKEETVLAIMTVCSFMLIVSVFANFMIKPESYYSINGQTKVTDVKSYSTNGNTSDNNTQTIYFIYKDHIYNVQSPDNKVVKKGDTIQFKSSKYAAIIDNGTISKTDDLSNQTLDIKINSKN